jgi:curli biogenesis system outer membrane secretion channel CsgG
MLNVWYHLQGESLMSTRFKQLLAVVAGCAAPLLLSGCLATNPVQGGSPGAVDGAAGGGTAAGKNPTLESCDETLGTLSVFEDTSKPWWNSYYRRYPDLGSTVPVIRLMIQQSNCFVVVERGRAMDAVKAERALQDQGELRSGSNVQKGQLVAADYTMSPSVQFAEKGTGALGGALAGKLFGNIGAAIAGGMKSNEASTSLLLVDNRSAVQVAAATGSAKNYDLNLFGGLFGSGAVGIGGYGNTPEGKIITAAFADPYCKMVAALRNYQAQTVEGGLGKGGKLKVAD